MCSLIIRFFILLGLFFPAQVSAVMPIVAAASNYTVALKSNGTLVAWGHNNFGQLGDGTTTDRLSPVAVHGLSGVVTVAVGYGHTVAVKSDGTVVVWGQNNHGQLGDGSTTNRSSPVVVPELNGVIAVSAGESHSVAVKSDGTVMAWGHNNFGQLGDGTTTDRLSPVAVPKLNGVASVASKLEHTVALKSNGTVMTWGHNDKAQLGDGTTIDRLSPVTVPGLSGVVAVSASFHTVALKSNGTVVTWGWNKFSQLGEGTTTDRLSPVTVPGLNGVTSISAGYYHTVAVKSDGTILAWGWNDYGRLGDGTTATRLSPVSVPEITAIVLVAAGWGHNVAVRSDGAILAWGYNDYGQLGDGTTTTHLSPVMVSGGLNLDISEITTPALVTAPISDDRVFAFAEANYHSLFSGIATNSQYLQYNYRYYPASGNYLAVDTSGVIFMLGTDTHNMLTAVGPVMAFASAITAWEATPARPGTPNIGTITPSNQTVSFGTVSAIAVGETSNISATATSGLAINFSSTTPDVCSIRGSAFTGITAGICTIAANQAGNASYNAAAQVLQSFTITQTLITPSESLSKTWSETWNGTWTCPTSFSLQSSPDKYGNQTWKTLSVTLEQGIWCVVKGSVVPVKPIVATVTDPTKNQIKGELTCSRQYIVQPDILQPSGWCINEWTIDGLNIRPPFLATYTPPPNAPTSIPTSTGLLTCPQIRTSTPEKYPLYLQGTWCLPPGVDMPMLAKNNKCELGKNLVQDGWCITPPILVNGQPYGTVKLVDPTIPLSDAHSYPLKDISFFCLGDDVGSSRKGYKVPAGPCAYQEEIYLASWVCPYGNDSTRKNKVFNQCLADNSTGKFKTNYQNVADGLSGESEPLRCPPGYKPDGLGMSCVTGIPTPTCTSPKVLQNGICVTPTPTCTSPKVLQNGVCVTPTPEVKCVAPNFLSNGECLTPISLPPDLYGSFGITTPLTHSNGISEYCSSYQVIGAPIKYSTCAYKSGSSGFTVIENNGLNADVCWTVFFNNGKKDSSCFSGMPSGKIEAESCYSCGLQTGVSSFQLTKYKPI